MLDNSYVYLARNAQTPTGSSTSKFATLLDPLHPATKLKPQQIPSWQADGIKIRLVPMALLQTPEPMCGGKDPFYRPFISWAERIQHAKKAGMRVVSTSDGVYGVHDQNIDDSRVRIPMSYLTATSKERMGPKRYMRRRITTRIKTTLNLIVTRGAYVDQNEIQNGTDQPRLKFDNREATLMGEKWIMQGNKSTPSYQLEMPNITTNLGWSYIFYPTTEVYNMPYPKLVTLLRQGLQTLYNSATKLEQQWLKDALLTQPLPRLKHQQTDPRRKNKNTREKPTKRAMEPSTHKHQVKMAAPSLSSDPAHDAVEKPQESGPKPAPQIKSSTAVKPELWESQLLSGLAIMEERLGKRR